jgi:hypothetical protein
MLRRTPYSEEIRLQELRATRKALWRRFEDNPNEIHLAAKLKIIDDQIAGSNHRTHHVASNTDDFEAAADPEVGGLFLLLAVLQRPGSSPDSAQPHARDSTSECANVGPPRLQARVSSGREIATARTAMLPPRRNAADSPPKPDCRTMAPEFRDEDASGSFAKARMPRTRRR